MTKRTTLESLLCDLVAIPSINPSLDKEGLGCGEKPVTEYLEHLGKKVGLSATRQKVLPGRENLVLKLSPSGKVKQKIFLAPHLDVVPGPKSLFSPKISDGRLFGRGSCDTKASVASFFQAICDFACSGKRLKNTEILFIGLVDEEFAQSGSRKFAQVGPRGDLAIVGEPTQLQVVSSHKGSLWIQLRTSGKSAHGSTPEKGVNAIASMQLALDVLLNDYQKTLSAREHPLLGRPSLSIGTIRGGTQPNVVPETCLVDLDRRTIPEESAESVIQELNNLFQVLGPRAPKVLASRKVPCPPLHTDACLPLVQKLVQKVGRRRTHGVPYFTDASPLAMGGTPSVVFGPGNIAQAHSQNEWVSLKQLELGYKKILHFLTSLT